MAMGTRADRTVFCNNFSNAMLETDFVQLLAGAAVQVGAGACIPRGNGHGTLSFVT